jgi:hypothetical protein
MATGTVIDLWRWPVLGMRGEQLRSSRIDSRGVAGDRVHVVGAPSGPLTYADVPRIGDWSAIYAFTPDGAIRPDNPPYPTVVAPDERRFRWGDPRLLAALELDLERRVDTFRDIERVRGVIVATQPPPDPGHAGVNLQLELEPPAGGWSGTELAFAGGARLRLYASRADGPGIEALVMLPGRVTLGEEVELG